MASLRGETVHWRGTHFGVEPSGVIVQALTVPKVPEDDDDDEDPFPAGPLLRRFRWRRGLALSGQARDQELLVSTWLAQPAALVENSKLIDAPPHNTQLAEVVAQAKDFDLVVAHTSVPSFKSRREGDRGAEGRQSQPQGRPDRRQGRGQCRRLPCAKAPVIDFVARNEFDFTIKDVADDLPWGDIKGISWRNKQGVITHNDDRPIIENMDTLPFVTPVYKRDLVMENYFIGYLKHPYISIYTGRGCKSRCTFCLWPQTVGGHNYRTRSSAMWSTRSNGR